MDPHTALFQQHRPRLFGPAYRMLGTPSDAENVLHDAWLRWHAQDTAALEDPEAWLVAVTTRIALDHLHRARPNARTIPARGRWPPNPSSPRRNWNAPKASPSPSCCCWSG